jgi:hypothetical protein
MKHYVGENHCAEALDYAIDKVTHLYKSFPAECVAIVNKLNMIYHKPPLDDFSLIIDEDLDLKQLRILLFHPPKEYIRLYPQVFIYVMMTEKCVQFVGIQLNFFSISVNLIQYVYLARI